MTRSRRIDLRITTAYRTRCDITSLLVGVNLGLREVCIQHAWKWCVACLSPSICMHNISVLTTTSHTFGTNFGQKLLSFSSIRSKAFSQFTKASDQLLNYAVCVQRERGIYPTHAISNSCVLACRLRLRMKGAARVQ